MEIHAGQRIHFVGIGGVRMSALAELLHRRGCLISGTDRQASPLTQRLSEMGVDVRIGHSAAALGKPDLVISTPAVGADNPELLTAASNSLPVMKGARLLGELTAGRQMVAVSGTHGKTTTTAMTAAVLTAGGLDPTVLVGGVLEEGETNLRIGADQTWVIEADEYDRSFLTLSPTMAVVTSLEADHLDCYEDLEAIFDAFSDFARAESVQQAVMCGTDPNVRLLGDRLDTPPVFYGTDANCRFRAVDIRSEGFGSRFTVLDGGTKLGEVLLQLPGVHNVSNALAAVAVGCALGIEWAQIESALDTYRGVQRRFEVLGEASGVTVVSDYAHHPTEVRATLTAASSLWNGRLVAVFQPHLYSRTRDFADDFGSALGEADVVWLTDVYAAREAPLPGIDGRTIASHVTEAGGPEPEYAEDLDRLVSGLMSSTQEGDLVLVMGAGDVEWAAHELYRRLQAKSGTPPVDG